MISGGIPFLSLCLEVVGVSTLGSLSRASTHGHLLGSLAVAYAFFDTGTLLPPVDCTCTRMPHVMQPCLCIYLR